MMRQFFIPLFALMTTTASAQTGSEREPVSYIGGEICNPRLHDGGLAYAIGAENVQVMRANRTHPDEADGYGWTYNHAANITYWHGKFYLEYLSNPVDEQQPPGQTLLVTSDDGRHWSKPFVAFPPYQAPKGVTIPSLTMVTSCTSAWVSTPLPTGGCSWWHSTVTATTPSRREV